jgi:polyketide cyclase/dehydrase/lipid transport protein
LTRHRVVASARIAAGPARVYAILADYRHGHRHILPRRFSDVTIERGGFGAGTIIRFRLRVAGRWQTCRAAITEPDPGRVLAETNLDGRLAVTTFTVAAASGDESSMVTIATDLPTRTGMLGAIERFLTTRTLRPLYRDELRRLAVFAESQAAPVSATSSVKRNAAPSPSSLGRIELGRRW